MLAAGGVCTPVETSIGGGRSCAIERGRAAFCGASSPPANYFQRRSSRRWRTRRWGRHGSLEAQQRQRCGGRGCAARGGEWHCSGVEAEFDSTRGGGSSFRHSGVPPLSPDSLRSPGVGCNACPPRCSTGRTRERKPSIKALPGRIRAAAAHQQQAHTGGGRGSMPCPLNNTHSF